MIRGERFALRWGQFAVALTIYAYFYLAPAPLRGGALRFSDITLHAIGSMLLFLSFCVASRRGMRLWVMVAVIVGTSFCFEFAQSLVRVRVFDVEDLGGNAVGVVAGAVIVALWSRFGPRQT